MNESSVRDATRLPMGLGEYRAVHRRVIRVLVVVFFVVMLAGQAGGVYLTYRIAMWFSWGKGSWQTPLVMFPLVIAPIVVAGVIMERLDRRIGLRCECGQSLTIGRHTGGLTREGGKCPRCDRVVVKGEQR